jgi:hypothetical protein
MAHNRSVLKERRRHLGALTCFAEAECPGLALGISASKALRGIGPARAEEARGRRGFRAVREGIVVIASKARCGPIPLRLAYLCGRSQEGSGKVRHSECPNGAPHV